jgi:predicted MFS family arabinose efflux permease
LVPLLAIVDLHAGPFWMGALNAATWLPWLVIGLPVGALVDRLPARGVMITADLVGAVALGSVPVVWASGLLTLAQLGAVALVNGTCSVFFLSAYPALVKQVVASDDDLTGANARMFGTEGAARVAGLGLGGWLAGALGAANGLLIDVLSFLVSAACLWRLPLPRPASAPPPVTERLADRIRVGLRVVYGDPLLRFLTVTGGVSNFGLTGFGTLTVLFLVRSAQVSPTVVGVRSAAGGLGGMAAAGLVERLTARLGTARSLVVLQLISGPAPLLLGLVRSGLRVALVPIALVALTAGVVAGNAIKGGFRMRYVPAHLQGRAVTAAQLVNFGTMPLAALCAGWLGATVGLRATIVLMAAVHTCASLAILRSPIARHRDLPTSPRELSEAGLALSSP